MSAFDPTRTSDLGELVKQSVPACPLVAQSNPLALSAAHTTFPETVRTDLAAQTLGLLGGLLVPAHECRRKAKEADELAQKTTDPAVRLAYEEIARRWREMAERAERNNW